MNEFILHVDYLLIHLYVLVLTAYLSFCVSTFLTFICLVVCFKLILLSLIFFDYFILAVYFCFISISVVVLPNIGLNSFRKAFNIIVLLEFKFEYQFYFDLMSENTQFGCL